MPFRFAATQRDDSLFLKPLKDGPIFRKLSRGGEDGKWKSFHGWLHVLVSKICDTAEMDPRYPVGKFTVPEAITSELRAGGCAEIAAFPRKLREAAAALSEKQLETSYRDGGWTARQVIHHLADSHMNSYVRFRLALTEDVPTIKPYDEARWAELCDAKSAPIEASLTMIESMHDRWSRLLQSMTAADFARTFRHPELGERSLDVTVQLYAWHGRHHLAHLAVIAGYLG